MFRISKIHSRRASFLYLVLVWLFLSLLLVRAQSDNSKNSGGETILVRIGDKAITVPEFYERAEYTIRPEYVKFNSNIEKKIILNSLVAEKLMVLERGSASRAHLNENITNNVKGIKEQFMRQILYQEEGVKKAVIDSLEFLRRYKLAGRTYDLQFMNFSSVDDVLDSGEDY